MSAGRIWGKSIPPPTKGRLRAGLPGTAHPVAPRAPLIKCFLAPSPAAQPIEGVSPVGSPASTPKPGVRREPPNPKALPGARRLSVGVLPPAWHPMVPQHPRVTLGAAPTPGPSHQRRVREVAGAVPAPSPRLLKHRGWVRGGGGGWRVQGGGRGGVGGQPDPAIQRSEEVCLDAVWFPMEGGEDAGEGSRHSLGGLPGLQQLGRVGGTAAAPHPCPEGCLEGLGGMAGSQGVPLRQGWGSGCRRGCRWQQRAGTPCCLESGCSWIPWIRRLLRRNAAPTSSRCCRCRWHPWHWPHAPACGIWLDGSGTTPGGDGGDGSTPCHGPWEPSQAALPGSPPRLRGAPHNPPFPRGKCLPHHQRDPCIHNNVDL